jgi:hypothetical protein
MSEQQRPADNEILSFLPRPETITPSPVRELEGYRTELLQQLEEWPWKDN